MKKSIFILIITAIIVLLVLSSLVVFAGNEKQEPKLQDKVSQEINYLNKYLVSLLGSFNGLNISENKSNSNRSESSKENDQSQNNSQGNEQNSQNANTGNNQNSNEQSSQGGNNQTSNNSQSGILVNQGKYETDWNTIQSQIEGLYQTWNTVSIDLHSLGIESNSILAFSDLLNNSTQNIKKKDKAKSMESVLNLYQLLPQYSQGYKPDSKETNLLKVQSNIVTAYVNVSNEKWQDAQAQLSEANKQFTNLLNSVNQNFQNQATANQCYVLINELNKAARLKDKDIFYIEYQNLMKKMEAI